MYVQVGVRLVFFLFLIIIQFNSHIGLSTDGDAPGGQIKIPTEVCVAKNSDLLQ